MALTRAEKGLYLSEADGRNFDGSPRYPSRFLLDIDPGLLTFPQEPQEGLIRDARSYIDHSLRYLPEADQTDRFSPGQRVEHAMFGPGTVLEVDLDRGAYSVQFDSIDTPGRSPSGPGWRAFPLGNPKSPQAVFQKLEGKIF